MASSNDNMYVLHDVPHPGAHVSEYIENLEWSQSDLARRTGLTAKTISELCNGKTPITANTALALEKTLRRPAHFWLNLQRQYDEATARRRAQSESAEWSAWAARFPIKEMQKLRFFEHRAGSSSVDDLLTFLGVSSPDSWRAVWEAEHVAYRQTRKFRSSPEAISAWVRATEIAAESLTVARFDEARLRASIGKLRELTQKRADTIMEPVQKICGDAGVAVVWVPELPHSGISGCARWLTATKALIGLTLRYKTDDQLWFTLFHEIGHILLHRRVRSFVMDNAAEAVVDNVVDPEMQKFEDEAHAFARDALIPPDALEEFIREGDFGNEAVIRFSDDIGIGPGILIGRLQHERILKPHQGNSFKQRLDFEFRHDG